jgi:tRNA nucleotidyltransferase (CCA-adding enzyme)
MKLQIPGEVLEIIEKFENANYEIYIVGGAVRDVLMGKNTYDWDFTTNATPPEMLNLFADAYYTNDFGMVGIPSKNEDERPFEITTFRTESGYSDARRPDKVAWGKSLEEDLQRRDFTINSMALKNDHSDKESYFLIDHYNGQKDLKDKLVRAVGDPNARFSEDALRMMRAVRIATELGFQIEEKTFEAIKANVLLIHKISKERVRDELIKIVISPYPYEGMMMFRNSGLMQEILPELEKGFGVEQASPGRHHIYDVGTHSLMSLKYVAERNTDSITRLATLIHDIGKPPTFKKIESGTITFYNHEVISARIAKNIAERLRLSSKQAEKLWRLVRWHQFTVNENQTDSAIRRFITKVGLENVSDMLDLRIGDRLGGGARETSWRLEEFKKRLIEVQKQPFTVKDLKIGGADVMKTLGIEPGPKVGEILKRLYTLVIEKKIDNERDTLFEEIKKIV